MITVCGRDGVHIMLPGRSESPARPRNYGQKDTLSVAICQNFLPPAIPAADKQKLQGRALAGKLPLRKQLGQLAVATRLLARFVTNIYKTPIQVCAFGRLREP